uniref:Putative conserved secreted protein n=1 Tax=Ixodes ricinus TaxID=34613 RepID=A0A6B0UQ18_IXORI
MKVVCIIVLFVIVAANVSATSTVDSPEDAKGTKEKKEILKFPRFIPNPKEFATELLDICKKNKTPPSDYNAINDKHVDFKNCTFLCKHGPHINVTLDLPEKTPCGPSGQTCAEKSKCVGHIPGC